MTKNPAAPKPWWGEYTLEDGQTGRWRIGALTLWAQRRTGEWRLAHGSTNDPFDDAVSVEVPCREAIPSKDLTATRYGMKHTNGALALEPALPDRAVVSRPDTPFYVLAGEEVRLYISTPIWVRVGSGGRTLLEVPVYRPSDTWFGPSTREGEVCYDTRTTCRTELSEVPRRPHRAVAAVRIRNRTEKPVLIERLNLPVPFLSVYASPPGTLWTQGVTLEMVSDGGTAELRIDKGPPPEAQGAALVSGPREDADKNLLVRALSALIG
ncbi:MAG: hypothetical protein AB1578_03190 [Thermodesulfobacteriota bacterium]